MYDIFNKYNPNFTLKNGPNCVSNLRKLFEHKLKDQNILPKVLDFASNLFVYIRIATINRSAKKNKHGAQKNFQTLRGTKKTAQLSH